MSSWQALLFCLRAEVLAAAVNLGCQIADENGVEAGVDAFENKLPLQDGKWVCEVCDALHPFWLFWLWLLMRVVFQIHSWQPNHTANYVCTLTLARTHVHTRAHAPTHIHTLHKARNANDKHNVPTLACRSGSRSDGTLGQAGATGSPAIPPSPRRRVRSPNCSFFSPQ